MTQGGHISTEPRINERIRVPEVRLVGPAGEQVGIVAINDALRLAQEADLDLVEVAPMARPPVAKLMDYGKFKYESALKARESRKNQAQTVIKEIKLRPKIDPHDYGTKKGHVERFLKQGDKVKVTIMFRGREQSRPELGFKLLQRLAGDIEELGFVESSPKQDGRNMIMVIGPHKRKTDAMAAARADRASRSSNRGTEAPSAGSDTIESDSIESDSIEPDSIEPDSIEVASAEPASTEQASTEPADTGASAAHSETPSASGAAASRSSASARTAAARQTAGAGAPADSPGPTATRRTGTTQVGSGQADPAAEASASDAPPRPAAPRPASPRPSAPRPTPASARPAAPKPSAPRATPASSARPGPAANPAPRPTAPRGTTAAPRPAASTSAAPKPGPAPRAGDGPVPSQRADAADKAASAKESGEADK